MAPKASPADGLISPEGCGPIQPLGGPCVVPKVDPADGPVGPEGSWSADDLGLTTRPGTRFAPQS
jgi:hypothetical protein